MIEYVYKLDVRDPSVILKEGFSGGATSHLDPRIYGSQTIQACRSVLGLISFGLERINGRSGERVERPQYLPPRLRPIGNGVLYAYRIDIRGLEHIEVTPELGFSYPTTLNHAGHFSNGEDIRQLNYCSPLIPSFRGQREREIELTTGEPVEIVSGTLTFTQAWPEMSIQHPISDEEAYRFHFTWVPHMLDRLY